MTDPATVTIFSEPAAQEFADAIAAVAALPDSSKEPVRSAERLVTLSMMMAASAASDDADRLSIVAHRYMRVLVELLTAWGRSMCDGPDGLAWATVQLGLLVDARKVIASANEGTPDIRRAQNLVDRTEQYRTLVRAYLAPSRRGRS